jgi:hypothetical protein
MSMSVKEANRKYSSILTICEEIAKKLVSQWFEGVFEDDLMTPMPLKLPVGRRSPNGKAIDTKVS